MRSTLSQLLNHVEDSIRAWENGKVTDTVYLDFAKAFDKVDHDILCHKLENLGINGKVGIWVKEFFSGRSQQVSANGILYELVPVISGVPQGTVMGSILFIIMISDLDKQLIYSKVSNQKDTENFQRELNEVIYPWAPTNNMSLNGDTFDYHRIRKNQDLRKPAIETQRVILLPKKTIL